jgi:Skp family chaperone for outer membrane proteins
MDAGQRGGSAELEVEERKPVNRRTLWLVAGVAALAVTSFGASYLFAQAGGNAPAATGGTRVAIVNVGVVFTKYDKAKAFKAELTKKVEPYKLKMDDWRKQMIQYQELLQKGDGKYKKEDLEKAILERKRALEDTDREVRNLVGKQSEDQLVHLWKEINSHIKAIGATNGFHLVFGYGDPQDSKDLDTFANINRKMQGMDLGGVTPLYIAQGLDISEHVVQSLNAEYHRGKGSPVGASNLPTK